ncbi:uncharacterized protein LOC111477682 isoform X1 [Cucurbita maxima]|uniref:Uncharacterized protein LOC111477682 isoform X1 n=1 Tax=Cucurbita maxima TaxID=3661 RepID=A0A6J1IJL3_CUCMA|nr:uncharacterized protein LOC111477682 isoform X1 [Cucurbita maxima]
MKLKVIPVNGMFQRGALSFVSILQIRAKSASYRPVLCYSRCGIRLFNCGSGSVQSEFSGENAYDILRVSETSSSDEIKASFRKLAKETHPDLAESRNNSAASQRFVQILAAYEILSDSEKRALYDSFLVAQRKLVKKNGSYGSISYVYKSNQTAFKQMEVVEWLKSYRSFINEILSERKPVVVTDYFDELERDFYLAMHVAYFGPTIESMELLPDCFEAEERSTHETSEILHLVSGRDLFGIVSFAEEVAKVASATSGKSISSTSRCLNITQAIENVSSCVNLTREEEFELPQASMFYESDAYKDLELHICGKVIARASRHPPKFHGKSMEDKGNQDQIHVFLSSNDEPMHTSDGYFIDFSSGDAAGARIPLGSIFGLGTSEEEGSCSVYNKHGTKTHVIMKHRTLMVKHMHWYSTEKVSVCECRCSRARLPPSKFWLFEPRCGLHDVGGWYVETFGKNKKGRTVPSKRFWDGFDSQEQCQERLHPAMYLIALAYRTLDIEDARLRKQGIRDTIKGQLFRILNWSKKLI